MSYGSENKLPIIRRNLRGIYMSSRVIFTLDSVPWILQWNRKNFLNLRVYYSDAIKTLRKKNKPINEEINLEDLDVLPKV